MSAAQLPLPLPVTADYSRANFLSTPATAPALSVIDAWRDWPTGACILAGPEGAGKTHLAHIWAGAAGASVVAAQDLSEGTVAALATAGPVCVEDVPRVAGQPAREAALFHLYNLVLAEGHSLLLTGRDGPDRWPIALPDLASRIGACTVVTLDAPDDALLSALLVKLFADRGIVPGAGVVPYIVVRMPRRYSAAQAVVAALDAAAFAKGSGITRTLAARVLETLFPDTSESD